jgi:tetratricopeptide (TPR) repeat protein
MVQLALFFGLVLAGAGLVQAQSADPFLDQLIRSYDLLEAGKLDQARQIYDELLKTRPGDPLVLNNLAALLVKQGKLAEAAAHLEKALPKAKGYKVRVNQVCDAGGVCLAFRPLALEYGNQDLEPLVRLNLEMVQARLRAAGP